MGDPRDDFGGPYGYGDPDGCGDGGPGGMGPVCAGIRCDGPPTPQVDPSQVNPGPKPMYFSNWPVELESGVKIESVTDLIVDLPGQNFVFSRNYRSDRYSSDLSSPGIVGNGWMANTYEFLRPNDAFTVDLVRAGSTIRFTSPSSGPSSGVDFAAPGNDKRTLTRTTVDPSDTAIWLLTLPGQYEIEFHRDPESGESGDPDLAGLIKEARDLYGSRWEYEWDLTFTNIAQTINVPRLASIHFFVPGTSGEVEVARVQFVHEDDEDDFNYGRLIQMVERRFVDSVWVRTREVDYGYKGLGDGLSLDVGGPGDLIEVVHSVLVDQNEPAGDPAWYDRFTQYRYHRTGQSSTSSMIEGGWSGQLKMILPAEQIEHLAQRVLNAEISMGSSPTTLAEVAAGLLESDDDETFGTQPLIDLASKIIAGYDEDKRVQRQYVLSGCACSGSTQGIRLEYEYFDHSLSASVYRKTTKVTQARLSETTPGVYDDHLIHYHELVQPVAGTLMTEGIRAVVGNDGSDTRQWVTNWTFDSKGNVLQARMPSALSIYTPGTSTTAPTYTPSASSGLVYRYAYNADNRRTKAGVSEGTGGAVAWTAEFIYGDSNTSGERDWMVKEVRNYRDETSHTADLVEVTTFNHKFRTSPPDALEFVEVFNEAELESENGPGGTYATVYFYDKFGRVNIVASADDTLTYSVFQPSTGQVETRYDHWDKTLDAADGGGTWSLPSGLTVTTTGWGTRDGAGTKVVEFGRDALGRLTSITRPGGITTHTVRELRVNDQRSGLAYLAMVSLPHKMGTSSFDGPATITWLNAGGSAIRSSDFEVTAIAEPDFTDYTLGDETARRTTIHEVSGLVSAQREWHRLGTHAAYYETTIGYDSLGRVASVTNDNGTVTERSYDVLGRVVEVRMGTTSTTPVAVQQLYYDFTGTSSPAQGTGDGNLTWIRQLPDGTGTNDRDTRYIHDFRNRRIGVEMASEPHILIEYDNLNRPVRQLVFKGSFPGTPTIASVSEINRGRWSETSYSQRGLAYRQAVAIDPTNSGGPTQFLESHTWFDAMGRPVGSFQPGSPMTKMTYDAFGRRSVVYVTDRAADAQPGTAGNYADVYDAANFAAVVSSDHVLAQIEYDFIPFSDSLAPGQLALQTSLNRLHDEWGGGTAGPLDATNAIPTYRGYYYDAANRVIRVADFGTNTSGFSNTGSAPTIDQASPPDANPSSPTLVAGVAYDAIGRAWLRSSPRTYNNGSADVPFVTKYIFDALNREVAVIENYDNAVVAWDNTEQRYKVTSGLHEAEPDTDRVTSFVYDGSGNILKRIAHLPDGTSEAVQITAYNYEYAGTLIASNDLLAFVAYPDETTGQPGGTADYRVVYDYNRLGEAELVTDQNGTSHTYTRDILGRVTTDYASFATTGPGADISNWANTIEYTYDDFGRLEAVTTKSGSTVLNQLTYGYDELWQLEAFAQDPAGAVNLSTSNTSAKVDYTYAIAPFNSAATAGNAHNYSRLALLEYPEGNGFTNRLAHRPDYGSTAHDTNDRIARMTGSSWTIGASPFNHSVEHDLLGMGMPVITTYATPGLKLDRFIDPTGGTTTSGTYPALDRFGRVIGQTWASDTWDPTTAPALFDLGYEYDHNSNITARTDRRAGASLDGRDEQYTYDGLDRLTEALRGEVGGSFGSPELLSQTWDLDMLGNWDTFKSEADGTSGFSTAETSTRTHDRANQIVTDTLGTSSAISGFTYDDAGNMTTQPTGPNSRRLFTWDAWNRLVRVEVQDRPGLSDPWNPARTRAVYTYYGMHQRATAIADADMDLDAEADRAEHFYYDAGWRLLERRRDTFTNTPFGSEPAFTLDKTDQFVWGQRYIDELMYHRTGNAAGLYALTDRNFSVIAMTPQNAADSSTPTHRTRYTAYGEARTARLGDINADGVVNSTDQGMLLAAFGRSIGDTNYPVEADLNNDGIIDGDDLGILIGAFGQSAAPGEVSTTDTPVGYAGYIFDDATGLYCVRFRWYAPEMGRWLSRDPAGYVDGGNLGEYAVSAPLSRVDWSGLCAQSADERFGFDFLNCPQGPETLEILDAARRACGKRGCPRLTVECGYCYSVPGEIKPGYTPPLFIPFLQGPEGVAGCNTTTGCPTSVKVCLDAKDGFSTVMIHEMVHVRQCCDRTLRNTRCRTIVRAEHEAYRVAGQCDPNDSNIHSSRNCCNRACNSAAGFCGGRTRCIELCRRLYR